MSRDDAIAIRARAVRERARRLRRRIAAGAATAFIALFATISIQMASGHDPALAASRRTVAPATTATTATPSATPSASTPSSSSSSSSSSSPSPVTSAQS